MTLTPETLAAALDCPLGRARKWAPHLESAMAARGIDTPVRVAAFLAQVGHESGRLQYLRELWGPTAAQRRYEGRADLGNTRPGDGYRYRGRGLIQVTGRANYRAVGRALGVDFESHPDLLGQAEHAALSAAHYWHSRNLNALADAGDFEGICDLVNFGRHTRADGDSNGFAERHALWLRARRALGIDTTGETT